MMKNCPPLMLLAPLLLVVAAACGTKDAGNGNSPTTNANQPATTNRAATPATAEAPRSTLNPGEIPFQAFPTVTTTARADEVVLAPSYNWIQDAATKGPGQGTFFCFKRNRETPGWGGRGSGR